MTVEDLLPNETAMKSFLLRFIQDARHDGRIDVPSESSSEFLVLFGLIQRVRRFTQAYLRLEKAGFVSEASVLLRSTLEHAVTAQWAYLTPGGIDRLHVSLARAQADLAAGMIPYSNNLEWIRFEAHLRETVPPGRGLPKFTGKEGIMAELDSIHFLSTSYRVLSQVGHVTHQAAVDFVFEVDGETQLRDVPEVRQQAEMLYSLTGFCMLAAWLLARLEADEHEIRKLQMLCVQLHVPWRLDTHLPRERRRFPDEDSEVDQKITDPSIE